MPRAVAVGAGGTCTDRSKKSPLLRSWDCPVACRALEMQQLKQVDAQLPGADLPEVTRGGEGAQRSSTHIPCPGSSLTTDRQTAAGFPSTSGCTRPSGKKGTCCYSRARCVLALACSSLTVGAVCLPLPAFQGEPCLLKTALPTRRDVPEGKE